MNSGEAAAASMAAVGLGILLAEAGDLDGARAAYRQAIDSGPPTVAPMAAVVLGDLLIEAGDHEGAIAAYKRAIDSGHPEQAPKAAVNLGIQLAKRGDRDGARRAYQKAISSGHPEAAQAGVKLASLLNVPQVVYRAGDGHLHEIAFDPRAGSWGDFDVTAATAAPTPVGDPQGYFDPSRNVPWVVYRADDGHLHEIAFDPQAGSWGDFDMTAAT